MTESGPTKMSSSWRDKLFQVVPNAKSWVEAANWVKQQIYFMKEMRVDEKKRREWLSEEMKKSKKEEEEIRVKMKKKKKWESKNEEEEGRSEREEESVGITASPANQRKAQAATRLLCQIERRTLTRAFCQPMGERRGLTSAFFTSCKTRSLLRLLHKQKTRSHLRLLFVLFRQKHSKLYIGDN